MIITRKREKSGRSPFHPSMIHLCFFPSMILSAPRTMLSRLLHFAVLRDALIQTAEQMCCRTTRCTPWWAPMLNQELSWCVRVLGDPQVCCAAFELPASFHFTFIALCLHQIILFTNGPCRVGYWGGCWDDCWDWCWSGCWCGCWGWVGRCGSGSSC
jgi:hypothetical protein